MQLQLVHLPVTLDRVDLQLQLVHLLDNSHREHQQLQWVQPQVVLFKVTMQLQLV